MRETFPMRESKALSWIAATKLKITDSYRKHKVKRGNGVLVSQRPVQAFLRKLKNKNT